MVWIDGRWRLVLSGLLFCKKKIIEKEREESWEFGGAETCWPFWELCLIIFLFYSWQYIWKLASAPWRFVVEIEGCEPNECVPLNQRDIANVRHRLYATYHSLFLLYMWKGCKKSNFTLCISKRKLDILKVGVCDDCSHFTWAWLQERFLHESFFGTPIWFFSHFRIIWCQLIWNSEYGPVLLARRAVM